MGTGADAGAWVAVGDFGRPNGLAFAPDGKRLYISDTAGGGNPGKPNHLRAFTLKDDGTLGGGEVLIDAKEQEKAKAEADCKALQEEVDRKNQELKGKGKEEWNAYVKSLDGRKPKYCRLKNAGMAW